MAISPREQQLFDALATMRWTLVGAVPSDESAPRFYTRTLPLGSPSLMVIRGADGEPRVFREIEHHKVGRILQGL